MTTNINTSRESRRRKILERGADRLALISGRSYSLPLSDSLQPHQSGQISDMPSPNGGDGEISSNLPTNDSIVDAGCSVDPPLCTPETSIQTSRTPASDADNKEKSFVATSTEQRSTAPAVGSLLLLEQLFSNRFVTPSQISSAIAATESSRLFCSVIAAIFVVLSYLGFPLLGSNIAKSIICSRPLYIVLLTNLTLVLVNLLLDNQRGSSRVVGDSSISPTNYDWAEQAGNALEVGLLMKKAVDAVVMDCSIYATIVVAGFCLFH